MMAALAEGSPLIFNLSRGEDVQSTIRCLRQCGIQITGDDPVQVRGNTWKTPEAPLDCGNSGTTARLLMGLLAGLGITATFTGDASLRKRPMERVLKPLRALGIRTTSDSGHMPVTIEGKPTRGMDYTLPMASAQVKSAILLAGLGAPEAVTVREPAVTRDHTERLMQALKLPLTVSGKSITVHPLSRPPEPFELTVPGDPSTAAFFAAAAALVPQSQLILANISANPTRTQFYKLLKSIGPDVDWKDRGNSFGEPVGTVTVRSRELNSFTLSGADIPGVIDEIPILAILASQADGTSTIRDAQELRVKESDRLKALVVNLERMGVSVKEVDDGLDITGGSLLEGGLVTTFHDHRIAMAFSIGSFVSRKEIQLDDTNCVRISSPEFFHLIKSLQDS